MTTNYCRTKFRWILRSWRLCDVLFPGDGSRVHQLRQEHLQPCGTRVQERHGRQEHPDAELGHVFEGATELLTAWGISLLLQRDS